MERLRQLLVLTVADIRAVGPKTWNGWKAQLLRDLYNRTEEYLSGGLIFAGREREVDKVLGELREKLADWPAEDIDAHLERGHPAYWLVLPDADPGAPCAAGARGGARRAAPCRSISASIRGRR